MMAKVHSGDIKVTRDGGINPGGLLNPPVERGVIAGSGTGDRLSAKGSGIITVSRDIKKPPTHGPAK